MNKPIVIKELGEITKNRERKLAVIVMEYKGFRYLDVRLMNLEGEKWKYGHGITLNRRTFPSLLTLLNAHQEECELMLNAKQAEP